MDGDVSGDGSARAGVVPASPVGIGAIGKDDGLTGADETEIQGEVPLLKAVECPHIPF